MSETNAQKKLRQLREAFRFKFREDLDESLLQEMIKEEIAKHKKKFILEDRLRFFTYEELFEVRYPGRQTVKTENEVFEGLETSTTLTDEEIVISPLVKKRGRPSKKEQVNGEIRLSERP